MKIRWFIFFLCVILFFSCKSTPKPGLEEQKNAETTKSLQVTQEFQRLQEQVEKLREECLFYDAKLADENQWEVAEKYFSEANSNKETDLKKAEESFKLAKREYEALLEKTLANLKNQMTEKIEAIITAKDRCDILEFQKYNENEYAAGTEKLAEVLKITQTDNYDVKTTYQQATYAEKSFLAVLFAGFFQMAQTARAEAEAAKKQADSIKSYNAQKDAYAATLNIFKEGDTVLVAKEPEKAYDLFVRAKTDFLQIYEDVQKKRLAAESKIQQAREKIQSSADYAQQADSILPLLDDEE